MATAPHNVNDTTRVPAEPKRRERIELSDSMHDILFKLSEGNPGALGAQMNAELRQELDYLAMPEARVEIPDVEIRFGSMRIYQSYDVTYRRYPDGTPYITGIYKGRDSKVALAMPDEFFDMFGEIVKEHCL